MHASMGEPSIGGNGCGYHRSDANTDTNCAWMPGFYGSADTDLRAADRGAASSS